MILDQFTLVIAMPKPLTTWLPNELAEKFDVYCEQEGHCRSDMLRKITLEWLDKKLKIDSPCQQDIKKKEINEERDSQIAKGEEILKRLGLKL